MEHKEAQLRVQLQPEELIMKLVKESFQETSESERQSVISAQELAAALRSCMSQETTACNSWKSEVIRLTREVAEESTKRMNRRKLLALLSSSSTTTRNGLLATSYAVRKS